MQNTTLMIIGSLIIAAIVLVGFASGYMLPRKVTAPESVPGEVEILQKVVCNPTEIDGNGYTLYLPSDYNLYMDVYIKSTSKNTIVVDEIRPLTTKSNLPSFKTSIVLPPGSVYLNTTRPPWSNIGKLMVTAYPGDVYKFKTGTIEQAEVGLIAKYISSIPNNQPSSYTCPLGGKKLYNLSISGTELQATISEPGCAPTRLTSKTLDSIFIIGKLTINKYYYKDWDIPLYVHLGGTKLGLYYRGGPDKGHGFGFISLYNGMENNPNEYKPNHGNPFVFGYYYNQSGVEELYIDNGKSPVRTNKIGEYRISFIDLGIARAKPAKSTAPPIKFYAVYYNGKQHYIEIDYSDQKFKIVKDGKVIVSGSFEIHNPGDNVKDDLVNKGIAVVKNPTPDVDTIISVEAGATGRSGTETYDFYLPAMPGAKIDLVIAWEDLVGAMPPGSGGIDGNGDEWVRVTYFNNGTWRIAGFIARGGYKHVFKLGDTTVFVKPYRTTWDNKCASYYCEYTGHGLPKYVYMPWEEHPIDSNVQLVVLRDKTIVLKGLYPGDKVIINSAHQTKTYIVKGTKLSIDVVKEFGLKEVFDTVTGGGFTIIVNPSQQHLLHLIPGSVLVHIKSSNHNMWIKADAPVVISCREIIYVHSNKNIEFMANTSDYTIWSAYFDGNPLGVFPSIIITVQHGRVILHSRYGDYTYTGPMRITLAPPQYVGVARGNIQLVAIPYVYKVEVEGKEYTVELSMGK